MEWSDYKVHKYLLKAYGTNEQISKTVEEMDRLKLILKDSSESQSPDKAVLASSIASVEVMLEEMSIYFDINKEVDQAKSDALTNMAIAVGLVDADDINNTASKSPHKLKPEDVIAIREAYANNEASQTELAGRYNVTPSIISDTVNGVTYKSVGGPISTKKIIGKLSDEQVAEIREKYAAGKITQVQLAEEYDVTFSIINGITLGKLHRKAPGPITIKGKGHNEIPMEPIEPGIIEQIRSDYYSGNHTFQTLSEKYGIPTDVIRKGFRDGSAKWASPVKISKIGKINSQTVHRYVDVKGVIPGEVETYLINTYNPEASLEVNLSLMKNFAEKREWNAKTVQACKYVLKRAYELSE